VTGDIVVILTGLITRELGGKRYSQVLAACCVLASPLMLWTNSVFSMNAFDVLFWTLALYLIIIIIKKDDFKYWLPLGIVLGLGLFNKISALWGPRDATGEVVIRMGGSIEAMKESDGEVKQIGFFNNKYCMPYENNMPTFLCKNRRSQIKDDWADFKHFE
jgi:Dolichyl-phosphate-mannose-protein mannosyltransferase